MTTEKLEIEGGGTIRGTAYEVGKQLAEQTIGSAMGKMIERQKYAAAQDLLHGAISDLVARYAALAGQNACAHSLEQLARVIREADPPEAGGALQ